MRLLSAVYYAKLTFVLLSIIGTTLHCADGLFLISPTINVFTSENAFYSVSKEGLLLPYMHAFLTEYKDFYTPELESNIVTLFHSYMDKFKQSNDYFLAIAQSDEEILGWALFLVEEEYHRAIIELICIDPDYQRQGLGKKLVFSICKRADISSIVVVTRKINATSPLFYKALGFKETDFTLPDYPEGEMQGFELTLT